MWVEFFAAFALMLVFEGILPFLSPERWRRYASLLMAQNDRLLRIMGLACMVIGVIILTVLRAL
jgi:uncharacterized protein YjeT (DUF2065 family)